MDRDTPDTVTIQPESQKLSPELAAAMLYHDRSYLITYFLLLIIPELLLTSFRFLEDYFLIVEFLSRAINIFILYLVGTRWISRISDAVDGNQNNLGNLFLYGLGFWIVLAIPFTLLLLAPKELGLLVILSLIPVVIFALRYYFLFIPILVGKKELKDVAETSAAITKLKTNLALQAIIPPFGLMLIFTSLVLALSPDGRDLGILYFSDVMSGIFPLLSTYLSFAVAFAAMPDEAWHACGFGGYRETTLEKIRLEHPAWLSFLLQPKRGFVFILVGLLLTVGNDMRSQSMAPTPSIEILSTSADDTKAYVTLNLHDSNYHFRSFRPSFFRLAGPNGKDLSGSLPQVSYQGEILSPFARLPENITDAQLELEFSTDRKKEELTSLKDMYLWYRSAQLSKVELISKESKEATTQ